MNSVSQGKNGCTHQDTAADNASPTPSYDAKGNLTSLWRSAYGYSSENLLTTATGTSGLSYDPLMRLYQISAATSTRFGYDGTDMIGEYNCSNALQRRYVFGPGVDEPIVWYEGTGTSDRRWLHADERGSIIAVSNGSGNAIAINGYDEYGMPATGNIGRFQYTGQMWLSETGSPPSGLYHYKARAYSPRLGRFLQTDPIELAGGMNLYDYVGSDPINNVDPFGLQYVGLRGVGGVSGVSPEQAAANAANRIINGGVTFDARANIITVTARLPDRDVNPYKSMSIPKATGGPQKEDASEIVVTGYWRRQQAAGNPIASLGLQFCYSCSADWSTAFARRSLIGAIAHQPINGRYPSAAQVRSIYGQIRVALMNADQVARLADTSGVRGLLSAGQIYDYHVSVYASFGLSSSTFVGSYLTGSRSEAIASSWYWCPGCDR